MSVIEYRKRRAERLDRKRQDDDWITIKGTHVLVDDDKNIKEGPERLKGLSGRSGNRFKISREMSPQRTDYEYEPDDDRDDWVHKNVDKLQALYDEGGSKAINDEWYKFRMADSTKDIHEISKDEADEIIYDCPFVTQSLYDGWFRNADSSYKPKLTNAIVSTPEMRNAGLNLAYENYKENTENPLPFNRFLVTPIKMYRGGHGQKHTKDDVFSAYTFDRKMAEHFAGPDGVITEAEIRPIDTYGSMRAVGEAEIWVPRTMAPNKEMDSADERYDVGWERKDPVRWAFEDRAELSESQFSIDNDLLDSIIRDCEMIELFMTSKGEKDKKVASEVVDRCIDSIQRSVRQMTAFQKASNGDGAFFAGELDSDLGERENIYPGVVEPHKVHADSAYDEWLEENLDKFENDEEEIEFREGEWGGVAPKSGESIESIEKAFNTYSKKKGVERYKERRKKRLDAREPDAWITVNGNHIPVDEEGNPIGGQKKALGEGAEEKTTAESPGKKPPLSKSSINKKLNEIAESDMSDEEKVKAIKNEFFGLRPGTKIIMPESWNSEDGKPQTYTYDGLLWNDDGGWGGMSEEDMAYYFLDKDPNERPKIKSIPRDPDSVEASRKKREASKNYAMHPDGSIDGKYTKDFHNDHVPQEERDSFAKEIKDMVDYEKGWDPNRSLYRGEANHVGDKISAEIKRRAALRRGDKENAPINDQPQVEDIYDVLKDMRDFGVPEGFEPTVNSDLPKERTDAIVKEALDRFPTDWFRDADSKPIINIVDGPGRAICMNKGYITVYTQKDLGLSSGELTTLNDRAIVNDLAHELGHYIEWCNQKVQYSARDCLWERGKDSEIIDVEPGYQGYKDSFFNPYMGKIYSHGGTEIISMLMGNIGCFQPFSVLEGHEYDYSKGKYDGRKKSDKESLGYILGVLAGL